MAYAFPRLASRGLLSQRAAGAPIHVRDHARFNKYMDGLGETYGCKTQVGQEQCRFDPCAAH